MTHTFNYSSMFVCCKVPCTGVKFCAQFFFPATHSSTRLQSKKNCHHLWYSLISFLSFPFGEYSYCLFIIINYNKNKCSFEISKPCRTYSRALFDIHLANVSFWKPYQHICFTLKYWFIIARLYIFASNLRNCKCVINVRKFTNEDFFVRMRDSYKRFVKTWIRFANPWIRFVS